MYDIILASRIKADRNWLVQFYLSILAGICVSIGCIGLAFVKSDSPLPTALSGILGGFIFSFGLFTVFTLGYELFTANCLMIGATVLNRVKIQDTLRVLGITLVGNICGCCLVAPILMSADFSYTGILKVMANSKIDLPLTNLFARAILCNIVLCLGATMGHKENEIASKFLASAIPVIIFVACGFEHSIADAFILLFSSLNPLQSILCFGVVLFGNIVGGIIVSALQLGSSKVWELIFK